MYHLKNKLINKNLFTLKKLRAYQPVYVKIMMTNFNF